ncbi:P-loop NTPase fold protein [Fibrobacter sp.]|uniref:KAP family P-loop NTPase fold protein n=1 Tax=Fibrobacter sp. TaxID=35828 RepID=UPI00388FD3F6
MDDFDKMMSEIMAKKYAGESDQDLLEREGVIDEISKIIEDRLYSKLPLSLAITGIWGVGKSYVLKEIEKRYSGRCIVFHYDCWKNDYYDEPLIGILSAISGQLNQIEAKNPDEQQKHYYRVMREVVFQVSRGVIKNFTEYDIEAFRNRFADFRNLLKAKKQIDMASFDSLSNVSDVIEIVNNLLCGYMAYEGKKILFVVDELDRCLPDYAIRILNRLHHICYGSPVIQLVAVNDKELSRNINGLYHRDSDNVFARRYFNRFFTNYYRIPVGVSSSELVRQCWEDFDAYFANDSLYDCFGMLAEVVFKDCAIRERKKIIELLEIYHKCALGSVKEKYPIELACAELLELFRTFWHIDKNWTISNGNTRASAMFDNSGDIDYVPYTVTIFAIKQTDLKDNVKAITDFFLERYEKKHKGKRPYEFDELKINVFDRTIALLVNEKGTADGSSEIGRIVNVLKQDKVFKKCSDFLEIFRARISTYDE